MPTLLTVQSSVDMVARTMSRQCSPRDLDLVARDMAMHPKDYGAWQGPNWDEPFLRSELSQRIWNLPDHPDRIPPQYRGLPFRVLRDVLSGFASPLSLFCGKTGLWDTPESEAEEWLRQIACNRRCGGKEWQDWLNDPERWRFRYLDDSAYERIKKWSREAA